MTEEMPYIAEFKLMWNEYNIFCKEVDRYNRIMSLQDLTRKRLSDKIWNKFTIVDKTRAVPFPSSSKTEYTFFHQDIYLYRKILREKIEILQRLYNLDDEAVLDISRQIHPDFYDIIFHWTGRMRFISGEDFRESNEKIVALSITQFREDFNYFLLSLSEGVNIPQSGSQKTNPEMVIEICEEVIKKLKSNVKYGDVI